MGELWLYPDLTTVSLGTVSHSTNMMRHLRVLAPLLQSLGLILVPVLIGKVNVDVAIVQEAKALNMNHLRPLLIVFLILNLLLGLRLLQNILNASSHF